MTNKDFFEKYQEYAHEHMKQYTRYTRTSYIRKHFLPYYGDFRLSATGPICINKACEAMESAGYAQNTVFGLYSALLSFFKLAADTGYIHESPGIAARPVKPDLKERRPVITQNNTNSKGDVDER